jgi:hypothetical protein
MLSVVGLAAAYRIYQFETKPFDLVAFADLLVSKGYLVKYDPEVKDLPVKVHINQHYQPPDRFHEVFAYFIDTDRLLKDWRVPWSWKQYVRSVFWDNARAFFPERILMVDGGMTRRDYPRPTPSSSMTELALGSGKMDRKTYIEFVFMHEFTHLMDTTYMLPMAIPEAAQQDFKQGTQAMYSGNYERADQLLSRSVNEFRWYPDAWDHLGLVARRRGKVDQAVLDYERSLDINPDGEIALQDIIPALLGKGEFGRAEEAARKLEAAHAGNPEGPFWQGFLLMRSGQWETAITALDRARGLYATRRSPAIVDVDVLRVKAFRQLNQTTRAQMAIADLRNSCQAYPERATSVAECANDGRTGGKTN